MGVGGAGITGDGVAGWGGGDVVGTGAVGAGLGDQCGGEVVVVMAVLRGMCLVVGGFGNGKGTVVVMGIDT